MTKDDEDYIEYLKKWRGTEMHIINDYPQIKLTGLEVDCHLLKPLKINYKNKRKKK